MTVLDRRKKYISGGFKVYFKNRVPDSKSWEKVGLTHSEKGKLLCTNIIEFCDWCHELVL